VGKLRLGRVYANLCDAVDVLCQTVQRMCMCVVCGCTQVRARNVSAEVMYKTRYVNTSREAAGACDIAASALPSGE